MSADRSLMFTALMNLEPRFAKMGMEEASQLTTRMLDAFRVSPEKNMYAFVRDTRPVDRELFNHSAPRYNCVDYPNDGPHYRGRENCLWCGESNG